MRTGAATEMEEDMSKILIIEDEVAIADLEKDYLELSDFEVDICNTGDEGLRTALEGTYDLIILDLMLPGMDGFEVCKVRCFYKERCPLIEFDCCFVVFSQEFDSIFNLVMSDRNLFICFHIHEVVEFSVVVKVLHLLCFDVSLRELVVRVESFFSCSSSKDILILCSYKSSTLSSHTILLHNFST